MTCPRLLEPFEDSQKQSGPGLNFTITELRFPGYDGRKDFTTPKEVLPMSHVKALGLSAFFLISLLAGCLQPDTDDTGEPSGETVVLNDWNVHYAVLVSDLPDCDANNEGALYYVQEPNQFFACVSGAWQVIEIQGAQGEGGVNGISVMISSSESNTCPNGGSIFEIGYDEDANGTLDSDEVQTTVEICDGSNGTDGQDGADGANGQDGSDGLTSLIVPTTLVSGTECGYGGIQYDSGPDTNNDGELQPDEITATQYVCNGAAGSFSSPTTQLTFANATPPSMNCLAGGMVVSYGLDNGDGNGISANGILEEGEIDYSMIVCSKWTSSFVSPVSACDPNIISMEGILYFPGYTTAHGLELWRTDGTEAGTFMLKDANPGAADGLRYSWGECTEFAILNGKLIYAANDGVHGMELWHSDGTSGGTEMLFDQNDPSSGGLNDSNPSGFTYHNGSVYFAYEDDTFGWELGRTEGQGVLGVKDIAFNSADSFPSGFSSMGDYIYFGADDGVNGRELWRSDGTFSGTTLVEDINQGSGDGVYGDIFTFEDEIYFQADNGSSGWELWKSNGTSEGTNLVKDIEPGYYHSWPEDFTIYDGLLYFSATNGYGEELWVTNGTEDGTSLVIDINPVAWNSNPQLLGVTNGLLFFNACNPTGSGWGDCTPETFVTNGTEAGTHIFEGPSIKSTASLIDDQFYFAVYGTNEPVEGLFKVFVETEISYSE